MQMDMSEKTTLASQYRQRLRDVFEEASARASSIIFLDELVPSLPSARTWAVSSRWNAVSWLAYPDNSEMPTAHGRSKEIYQSTCEIRSKGPHIPCE